MSAEVMKEFLVSLGWKIDKQGEKDVTAAIAGVTKAAGAMALALGAAAVAAAAAVTKIAAGFDTLYFSSQRTGASVQNIKALQYAFSQVGSSSEAAASAIEAYAKAIRTNPGVGQYVKDLGVKQTGDAFNDLSAAIDKIQAKNPYYAGAQMAGLLGISEEQYQTFTKYRKEIGTYRAEYEKFTKQFGLNNDEAAKSSASFMRGLNSLGTLATVVGQKFLVALAPAFDRVVKGILSWIDANPEKIERIFNAIATAGEWVSKAFDTVWKAGVQLFDFLSAKAEELNSDGSFLRMWEKVVTVFDRVAAAIKSVLTWVRELDRATDMSAGLNTIKRLLGWVEGKTTGFVDGGVAAAGAIDRATDTGVGVPGGGGRSAGIFARAKAGIERRLGRVVDDGPRLKSQGNVPSSQQGREQRAMARLIARGWTPQAAATAIGQAVEESGVRSDGPLGDTARFGTGDAAAHGMFQWRDGRFRALKKFAEARGTHWQDFDTQVDFFDQERKSRSGAERDWHKVTDLGQGNRVGKMFEGYAGGLQAQREAHARRLLGQYQRSPAPAPAPVVAPPPMPRGFNPGSFDVNRLGAAPLGSSTVNNNAGAQVKMEHNTTIKIDGAGDPASVGSAVERAQGRANDLSLRNAQAAIR